MTNSIAFIFTHGPHGSSHGREGLDVLLSMSAINKRVGVFFISDGVLLLLPYQKPLQILAKDFIVTFGILSIYDIHNIYMCTHSANKRGLSIHNKFLLNVKWLSNNLWHQHLSTYNKILTF